MIRESLQHRLVGMNPHFRYRGLEPGRLENFSDAVFALAITLLMISTSPPANFQQIKRFTYDLLPFLTCITLIILIWHEHFVFFLRYGLRNARMIFWNTLFLVIILFYVYPLKFLTKLILLYPLALLVNDRALLEELKGMISGHDMAHLMVIYGLGASSVFFVLMMMYRYALQQADVLELSDIERFDTKVSVRSNLYMALVPLFSALVALILWNSWLAGPVAGFVYFLYTPIMFAHGRRSERERKFLLAAKEVLKPEGEK
ncbi:MAG: TMEM175 family protein [Cyclobacteriaceae bacterium]|jgi:uncharacterized membrane protein